MSPHAGWRSDMVDAPRKSTYTRCPGCYRRIPVDGDTSTAVAVYHHELSGLCSARINPRPIKKPAARRAKDRLTDSDWGL